MELEVYVRNYKDINKYLNLSVDTISFGDDGCIHKLPEKEEMLVIAKEVMRKNKKLKFVTPKVPQVHFEDTMDRIKELSKLTKDYTLVINDFGVLEACKERDLLPKNISVGRSISRSIEECTWYEDIIQNENEKYRVDLLSNNFLDNRKIKLMNQYGVNGIEASLLKKSNCSFLWLKEEGWKVSAHLGNITIAYSRNCQYAKYKKLKPKKCVGGCNEKLEIKMTKATNGNTFFDAKNLLDERGLDFYLIGNVLYHENDKNLNNIEGVNFDGVQSLVLTTDDYNLDEMESIIKRVGWANE